MARERILNKMGEGVEPLGSDARMHMSAHMGSNGHHSDLRAAARDAVLTCYGVKVADPHPAAADCMGMSVIDIANTCLSNAGRSTWGQSKAATIKAALTISDFPALMEDIAMKSAMVGFREMEAATHRAWTGESTLPDFKQARRVALSEAPGSEAPGSEAPGLEKVNEAGEYTFGYLSDAKESIRVDTYGRIVALTRQALINEDLGELTRVPQAMGIAAARSEADLVYDLLISNPTMRDSVALFHANHSNLAGTGTTLSVVSLGAARAVMRKQKGLEGRGYLNITPRFLIVPVAIETDAEQLMMQIQPNTTDNATPEWIRQLTVIAEPRLDDDNETAWHLAGNPSAHDTIEVATLDGEQPSIDQKEGFEIDALTFKVRIDVGAAAIDWRALYKNSGA